MGIRHTDTGERVEAGELDVLGEGDGVIASNTGNANRGISINPHVHSLVGQKVGVEDGKLREVLNIHGGADVDQDQGIRGRLGERDGCKGQWRIMVQEPHGAGECGYGCVYTPVSSDGGIDGHVERAGLAFGDSNAINGKLRFIDLLLRNLWHRDQDSGEC